MKFDYVPWAKTAQLLREHAPGWQFFLRPSNPNGDIFSYVHVAPDNTGFLMGYFEHIETGKQTSSNVFAITDNANRPIPLEKISCNSIQNSHRRCLCACACKDFGLAYELWAQIEIDEAKQSPPPPRIGTSETPTRPNQQLAPVSEKAKTDPPISREARTLLLEQLASLDKSNPDKMKELVESFRKKFGIKDTKITRHITTALHGEFLSHAISKIDDTL